MNSKCFCLVLLITLLFAPVVPVILAAGTTYYVSSSDGNDDGDGLSEGAPFETIAKVNALDLQPGDSVLFKCGDTWQAEQLVVGESGIESDPITFGSYPKDCTDKPVLSGSRLIEGWAVHSGSIYVADLSASEFPMGINQLFRDDQRLLLGRWPNLDAGNGGYTFVDSHTAGGSQIVDNELPSVNWTGAIVHLKNIRWSMIDRQVTGSGGTILTLNRGFSCLVSGWGACTGWGYFINDHLDTLDQDGEWYYDTADRKVYLLSASGVPSNVEGSVILEEAETLRHGGLMLSDGSATAYVVIDNFEIKNWFNHGIGTPGGMGGDIYHHITVRNVTIKDVDAAGVRLSSWLERPSNDRKGLRGGHDMLFEDNVIDGANHFGITGYFAASTFEGNQFKNIALIENLNKSGMGCGITRDECTENGDGFRIRCYDVRDSGYGNTLRYNRFEKIGYNGVDVFGPDTTIEKNVIIQSCYSKADCGAVRTFGTGNFATTEVYSVRLIDNVIVDIPGNVDGCHESRAAFGMGLYVDHYSRDVESRGNTIISTTITGINYQRSTGQIMDNTVYNASYGTEYAAHISLGSESSAALSGNVLYGLNAQAWTLYSRDLGNFISSDDNYVFHPYVEKHIAHGSSWTRYSFDEWKAYSGLENNSKTNWFTQNEGDSPLSRILYNDTISSKTIDLGSRTYLDLDQNEIVGSVTLQPFTSIVLIDNGEAALALLDMTPRLWSVDEAVDFTLTVYGTGFTPNSVVRWNGTNRTTGFISNSVLTATVSISDVGTLAIVSVTVHDPGTMPTETQPLTFWVVASVARVYLPVIVKSVQ
ncbi:MAG: right-handed parallel beta-helix repeat-containing protein [Chloroflexi bacterium]|nr:right-handed parallel beta-helix repeat-containing protein [Chloroflexota bacterium]